VTHIGYGSRPAKLFTLGSGSGGGPFKARDWYTQILRKVWRLPHERIITDAWTGPS